MMFRRRSIAAIAVSTFLGMACLSAASATETPASGELSASVAPAEAGITAYRQYVKTQADSLVGMTKLLATEIKDGNLDAAQSAYAPAHRYLKRIEPFARALQVLHKRMDARAGAYEAREADPKFSGFHRLEHGLFANKSTAGISDTADQLYKDARALREEVKTLQIAPGDLMDEAAKLVEEVAAERIEGDEELYSRTDLWDLEANMDGVQEVVALLQPQLQSRDRAFLAATGDHFAKINALLAQHKDGCGFKPYDQLSTADKAALKVPVAALAATLSSMRGRLAIN